MPPDPSASKSFADIIAEANATHRSRAGECLHCAINEVLLLSEGDVEAQLVACLQAAGERMAAIAMAGYDIHALVGQAVSAVSCTAAHYLNKMQTN